MDPVLYQFTGWLRGSTVPRGPVLAYTVLKEAFNHGRPIPIRHETQERI